MIIRADHSFRRVQRNELKLEAGFIKVAGFLWIFEHLNIDQEIIERNSLRLITIGQQAGTVPSNDDSRLVQSQFNHTQFSKNLHYLASFLFSLENVKCGFCCCVSKLIATREGEERGED